ncbi:MAG: carbamate kinase [Enterocloster asparagiformis]|nr:carbamate kinase [Enterocloster asparagiformis]
MAKKRIVIAIGHKDLGTNLPEQKAAVAKTAKVIADFIQDGWQVAIVHSNAPQVGMIHTAMNEFGKQHDGYSKAPMSVCSAMSQGYIGYDMQNGIRAELIKRGIYKPVSTVLTQVTVDPYDEAFYTPIKTIGRVMTPEEAEEEEQKGNHVVQVEGGYRRIVASPHPMAIVEIDAIKALLDADQIVIACGGGGIPVMEQGYNLHGASAIIEKDLASGLLAKEVDADVLMILTSVDNVTLNYGSPEEKPILRMNIQEARDYMAQGQFEFASMLPKVSASVDFIENGKGRSAIITSLDKAKSSLKGEAGTTIA